MPSKALNEMELKCDGLRDVIRDIGKDVFTLMHDGAFEEPPSFPIQHSEMKANIMLAYRHLEDARMRLGKVMQQIQG